MQEESCTHELHEECGVLGLYAPQGVEVGRDLYYGLMALQHRGQESAGISISDTGGPLGNIHTHKGMGLVGEVFGPSQLEGLKGNIGIGHVRYSTTGGSLPENAQPISMSYLKGNLSLVHNGNIINSGELKQKQRERGQAHYTTSDTEVLSYEIISARLRTGSIQEAVKEAAGGLRGGYAVIVMSPRKLVAVRDPAGIKPLMLGEYKGGYVLASESAAILAVGGKPIRDVLPGEILTISPEGISSDPSLCGGKRAHCIFEYIYFARSDSVLDGVPVYEARLRAGRALSQGDEIEADLVCGVPDSGLIAAQGYAAARGLPFSIVFHKNSYIGRSFIKPTDQERREAVGMKLSVIESAVKGKRLVLIDDSIVRGTTMKQLNQLLRRAGAAQVHVRISSPPFLYPCYYGTDVPSSNQLIASHHSTEEVRERIGADSLAYLKWEDLQAMVGNKLSFCSACFLGEYPV